MAGENYINHVALVLDASYSMGPHAQTLVEVVDGQIEYLARRSEELNQETRVSIYAFNERVQCLVYDKDVLRLPSIAGLYKPSGRTALIDATIKALDDLSHQPEIYGDHAFLLYAFTDGQENASLNRPTTMKRKLDGLPQHWTVATLVPDARGRRDAEGFGFSRENIAIWEAGSSEGVVEVGQTIRNATENFMQARSTGNFRGTRSLFSTGLDAVNASTVRANLTPLQKYSYDIVPVHRDAPIREYVYSRGLPYEIGKGFYQLTKTETIQPQKQIAIREKSTGQVFTGDAARDVLGLPRNMEVRVKPDQNPEYDVFVQSTSVNRKLLANTDVLVMH